MAARRWRLTLTEAGRSVPVAQTEVEAGHWLGALEAAQRSLGEPAGVPSGASCAVAPDEHVTIHDPGTRRRYHLAPLGPAGGSVKAPAPTAAAPPAAGPGRPAPPGPGLPAQTARRAAARTVAYDLGAAPVVPPPAPPAAVGKKTIAYNIADMRFEPPGRAIPVGAPPPPPAPPERPHGSLLTERNESPTPESPLHYRERTYFVREGTAERDALTLLRDRLETLRRELADAPAGKYVNLAAFDHAWKDAPERPPVVTLQWMDWRGEPEVDYPLRASQR